jgi:hypothetical protein
MKILVKAEWQFVSAKDHWIPWVAALQNCIRGKATVDIPDDPRHRGVFQIATVYLAIGQLNTISDNLRLRITASFPEEDLRREAMRLYGARQGGQEMVDKIMSQAEKVFEEGI